MRRVGTTDLAIVLALWSAMAIVLGGVISEVMADNQTPLAKSQSEVLAAGLAERFAGALDKSKNSNENQGGGRAPASMGLSEIGNQSGTLGKDPWGHAYRYKISDAVIVVWSGGADGRSESDASVDKLVLQRSQSDKSPFRFQGDDVGFIRPLKRTNARSF